MFRAKFLLPALILLMILLQPIPAVAQDRDFSACLPKCYASDTVLTGTTSPGDGTSKAPWIAPTEAERSQLRQEMANAVVDSGRDGTLVLIICQGATQCAHALYDYDVEGKERAQEPIPGIPPEVGVNVPFFYILGGGATLGLLLVGGGVLLWLRARRWASTVEYSGA
jgi:hypothetical protein